MAFSTKFLLDTKLQKSGLWHISNLGLFLGLVVLNIWFKNGWDFWNSKTYRKFKFHVVWVKLGKKKYFLRQSWARYRGQIHKIKSFFKFWVVGWRLTINSNLFRDFLENSQFDKILSLNLKSFVSLRGTFYIHLLVIIT